MSTLKTHDLDDVVAVTKRTRELHDYLRLAEGNYRSTFRR